MKIRLSQLRSIIREVVEAEMAESGSKAVDQNADGKNDFTDVLIARMVASGMSHADAVAKARATRGKKKKK